VTFSLIPVLRALGCIAALGVMTASAAAQGAEPGAATALDRVKTRLDQPARRLVPSGPIELRPVFKSRVERHPFVLTLDEDLHKTFDLNELQRQSAAWSAQCCGLSLSALFNSMEKALDERRLRKIREQVARELAFVEADAEKAAAARKAAAAAAAAK
jgi:hypothetical protein